MSFVTLPSLARVLDTVRAQSFGLPAALAPGSQALPVATLVCADFEYYLQPVGAAGRNEDEILKVRRQSMSIAAQTEAAFVVKLPQKTSGSKMIVVCSAPASDPTLGKIEIYNQKGKSYLQYQC